MLIIGARQLAALDAARLDRFRRLLLAHVREVLQDRLTTVDELEALRAIDAAIERAREFLLVAERDVARFVALSLAIGPDFPESPATAWTASVLRMAPDPSAAMDQLYDRLAGDEPRFAALWDAWRP